MSRSLLTSAKDADARPGTLGAIRHSLRGAPFSKPVLRGFFKSVKRNSMNALRAAGVYTISGNSPKRQTRLLILCYHGISLQDEHEWAGHLFITPERFRERLKVLRDAKANVLPLSEALWRLNSGSLPPRAVTITFDDGFYDFLKLATPLLQEFQFPATLYLTTYYSGRPAPIPNLALDYLIWKSGVKSIAFPQQGFPEPVPVSQWLDRANLVTQVMEWCESEGLTAQDKDDLARGVAERLSIDYAALLRSRLLQIMTPEEATQAHKSGVDIQLHTHRHRTPLDHTLFVREIADNREFIQQITGKTATHFCYPSGQYDRAFFPWLRECSVESATTCVRGFATPGVDPLLIPRVLDDSNMEAVEFEGVVSGLFA